MTIARDLRPLTTWGAAWRLTSIVRYSAPGRADESPIPEGWRIVERGPRAGIEEVLA